MALPTSPIAAGCAIPEVPSAWWAGHVAGLQVGRANGYSVCVWGKQFQSSMFLGTQPPHATTVFKCNIQQDVCIGRYRGQLRTEDKVHSFVPVWTDLDRLVTFLKLLFLNWEKETGKTDTVGRYKASYHLVEGFFWMEQSLSMFPISVESICFNP